ncbi:MAG: hypothetical protein NTZ97_04180 [Candidatus Moranbacteria bacterium]|nr:hypothetical protein [Candidatus Moranbacteria bacterium]
MLVDKIPITGGEISSVDKIKFLEPNRSMEKEKRKALRKYIKRFGPGPFDIKNIEPIGMQFTIRFDTGTEIIGLNACWFKKA